MLSRSLYLASLLYDITMVGKLGLASRVPLASMCLHECLWLVAKASTRLDVGHFMCDFHSLTEYT